MILDHVLISLLGAVVASLLVFILFRKKALIGWTVLASFLPDLPVFWLTPLGVKNLGNLLLVTHTVGIVLYPLIMVLADILLIELAWMKYLSFLPYPRWLKTAGKLSRLAGKAQKYNAIPRPARIRLVYSSGVIAGAIHLGINLWMGAF